MCRVYIIRPFAVVTIDQGSKDSNGGILHASAVARKYVTHINCPW